MELQEKIHPTLGILVRNDGQVFVPANAARKAHWSRGSRVGSYLAVSVNYKHHYVHRLVLETFVGPCPEGMECDHVNRDRSDNRLQNLRWVTSVDNHRNTASNDHCKSRFGVNWFENPTEYRRNKKRVYRKTQKCVTFADGKRRYVSTEKAEILLGLPKEQRFLEV